MTAAVAVQESSTWQADRAALRGLGSSDAPIYAGLSHRRGKYDLWVEKVGLGYVPAPVTPDMERAQRLERFLAAEYERARPGVRVRRRRRTLWHPRLAFMYAHVDRFAYGPAGERWILEIKKRRRATGWGRPGTDQVPDDVAVQVHHQLAVTGFERADVAVWIAGSDFELYTLRRQERVIEAIEALAADFWLGYVETGIPPDVDGLEPTRDLLGRLWHAEPDEVRDAGPVQQLDVVRLKAARAAYAIAKREKVAAENRVKAYLGAAVALLDPAGEELVTWRPTKDRETTDWEAVARLGIPELADLRALVEVHTTRKPGPRQFLVRGEEEEEEPDA